MAAPLPPYLTLFEPHQYDEWLNQLTSGLKGKDPDTLKTPLPWGSTLEPLYINPNTKSHSLATTATANWEICQTGDLETPERILMAKKWGQESANIECLTRRQADILSPDALQKGDLPVYLLTNRPLEVQNFVSPHLKGIEWHLLRQWLQQGALSKSLEDTENEIREHVGQCQVHIPQGFALGIEGGVFQEAGAHAAQELGIILAQAVYYQHLISNLTPQQAFSVMRVHTSVGTHLLVEAAKLRALRWVWALLGESYGITSLAPVIHAKTSPTQHTQYDMNNNLLRVTTQGLSAVLGGADSVETLPFDGGRSNNGYRWAINTQLLLKHESHLTQIQDPLKGAHAIEALTEDLAKTAWGFFQEIQAKGGLMEVLKNGWLQTEIQTQRREQVKAYHERKHVLVGNNQYALLTDPLPAPVVTPVSSMGEQLSSEPITPLPAFQLDQSLRLLRNSAPALRCLPVTLGPLKTHKPRLDFARDFLGCGGLTLQDPVDLEANLPEHDILVLCGSENHYDQCLADWSPPEKSVVVVAGPPRELPFEAHFVHLKANLYETLKSLFEGAQA